MSNSMKARNPMKILIGIRGEIHTDVNKGCEGIAYKEIYIILVTPILEKSSPMKMVLLVQIQR
jgi:hypothetical protein